MEIQTPRLLLREVISEDAAALFAFARREEHQRYDPEGPPTEGEFRDIVRWMIEARYDAPRIHHYRTIVRHEDPQQPLGSVYLSVREIDHRQAEIGYMIGAAYWGRGYATEAARHMVTFGFQELGLHRIYATDVIRENIGSIRVLEKLGMRREGYYHQTRYFRGRWWDTLTYAVLCTEWER